MSTGRSELVNPERRLPDLALPSAPEGEVRRLRAPGRRAPVLVLVHGHDCAACREFVGMLEAAADSLREWDGRVLVIDPEPLAAAGEFRSRGVFPVLADPEQRLASALSVERPALVIADQWGEVHSLNEAGEEHRFLPLDEIVTWLRFLAIQCPECQGEAL